MPNISHKAELQHSPYEGKYCVHSHTRQRCNSLTSFNHLETICLFVITAEAMSINKFNISFQLHYLIYTDKLSPPRCHILRLRYLESSATLCMPSSPACTEVFVLPALSSAGEGVCSGEPGQPARPAGISGVRAAGQRQDPHTADAPKGT